MGQHEQTECEAGQQGQTECEAGQHGQTEYEAGQHGQAECEAGQHGQTECEAIKANLWRPLKRDAGLRGHNSQQTLHNHAHGFKDGSRRFASDLPGCNEALNN